MLSTSKSDLESNYGITPDASPQSSRSSRISRSPRSKRSVFTFNRRPSTLGYEQVIQLNLLI